MVVILKSKFYNIILLRFAKMIGIQKRFYEPTLLAVILPKKDTILVAQRLLMLDMKMKMPHYFLWPIIQKSYLVIWNLPMQSTFE